MLKINYSQKIDFKKNTFTKKENPSFVEFTPGIDEIKSFARKFNKYTNIIIAGRGGSVTSFKAYWNALGKYKSKKSVFIADTTDPYYLSFIKKSCSKKNTLLIVISKSGTTVDVIENYLYFSKFKSVFITTKNNNTLHRIAKEKKIPVLAHPEVGGRYSGFTAVAFLPAYLVGLNIEKICKGAFRAYVDFDHKKTKNLAYNLASYVNFFYKKGYTEIYMPFYSSQLFGFLELFMQLIHESVAKNGKGPTLIPVLAPQSQHHSNQRYYGGKKNMQGVFIVIDDFKNEEKYKVSSDIAGIKLRDKNLSVFSEIKLADSMRAEFLGNWKDSGKRKVPASAIHLAEISEESIGYLTGFFHYFTVYLSWLNNVDPYSQPEVETSKEISFYSRFFKN